MTSLQTKNNQKIESLGNYDLSMTHESIKFFVIIHMDRCSIIKGSGCQQVSVVPVTVHKQTLPIL